MSTTITRAPFVLTRAPFVLTREDIAATKAACLERYDHDRLVGIDYCDPITGELRTTVLFADMALADASAYFDARLFATAAAGRTVLFDRALFPAAERLEELRETWPEFDRSIESEFQREIGSLKGPATVVPLSVTSPPPGLDPKLAAKLLADAGTSRLWSVSKPANGLSLVLRQPQRAIYDLSSASFGEAHAARRGVLLAVLGFVEDHYVWSPAASLRAHLSERQGRLEDVSNPWNTMGGAGAKTSARRF